MKRYFHIAFGMVDAQRISTLEATFGKMSDDWLRYTGTCWITWTQYDATAWFHALQPHLKPGEYLLILELKPNQGALQGMLPQWVWGWLNKPRS